VRFYNRNEELAILERMRTASMQGSKMTIVYGRRRIGKTSLTLKSAEGHAQLYLFVSRKSEILLCQDFAEEIQKSLHLTVYGQLTRFRDVFAFLMDAARQTPFTLMIDEFQEFVNINPSVFSEMQELWDRHKSQTRMNLIISGSVYRIMKKIFENAKEPLFGRADERIHLQPFPVEILRQVMKDHYPSYQPIDLLCFYAVTGGVPKYVELLVDKTAMSFDAITGELFRANSFWLDEGRNLLVDEFGKDYTVYFSILSLIAAGKTSRTEIESVLEKNIGGYLERLITDYQLVKVIRPVFSKPQGKVQKYEIADNFLKWWFRFVFKYKPAVEINNFEYLKSLFVRDFRTFAGRLLEQWFMGQLAESKRYHVLGNYWDRKGNEIDIVAVDESNRKIMFGEVKLNPANFKPSELEKKAAVLLQKFSRYDPEYKLFSLQDMQT
jgi:uncharacterized protein